MQAAPAVLAATGAEKSGFEDSTARNAAKRPFKPFFFPRFITVEGFISFANRNFGNFSRRFLGRPATHNGERAIGGSPLQVCQIIVAAGLRPCRSSRAGEMPLHPNLME